MINIEEISAIEPPYSGSLFYFIIAHFTNVLLTIQSKKKSFPPKSDRKHFETYVNAFFADSLKNFHVHYKLSYVKASVFIQFGTFAPYIA
jgi:hypothetical protein